MYSCRFIGDQFELESIATSCCGLNIVVVTNTSDLLKSACLTFATFWPLSRSSGK